MTVSPDRLREVGLLRSLLVLDPITVAGLVAESPVSPAQAQAFLATDAVQGWLVSLDDQVSWRVAPGQRQALLETLQDRLPSPSRFTRKNCAHTVFLANLGRWDTLLQEGLDHALEGDVATADERMPAINRLANLSAIAAFQCEVYPWADPAAEHQARATMEAYRSAWKAAAQPSIEAYNRQIAQRGLLLDEFSLL